MRLVLFRFLVIGCAVVAWPAFVEGALYKVGPGDPYATPSAVPWESLQPGDVVLIHWRSTPYHDK